MKKMPKVKKPPRRHLVDPKTRTAIVEEYNKPGFQRRKVHPFARQEAERMAAFRESRRAGPGYEFSRVAVKRKLPSDVVRNVRDLLGEPTYAARRPVVPNADSGFHRRIRFMAKQNHPMANEEARQIAILKRDARRQRLGIVPPGP